MEKEIIIKTIRFGELPEKVKDKVFSTFVTWLKEVYGIVPHETTLKGVLAEISPWVEFYLKDNKKLFRIDDSDEKLGRFFGASFAISAAKHPELLDRVVMNMIKRNEDNPRLKML